MYAIARWICHVTANVHLENIYILIYQLDYELEISILKTIECFCRGTIG